MHSVEIIILNFNGARFLGACLDSLGALIKTNVSVSIVVADNGSTDDSEAIVKERRGVIWLPLSRNLGFARGNNAAVQARIRERHSKGLERPDYIIFLNNDVEVDSRWLSALLSPFEDLSIGIVSAKAIFHDLFVKVRVGVNGERPFELSVSGDHPSLSKSGRVKCLGAGGTEDGRRWRLSSSVDLLIPAHLDTDTNVDFELEGGPVAVTFTTTSERVQDVTICPGGVVRTSLCLPGGDAKSYIQNAGSFITKNLLVGDRGFLELDEGQYDIPCDLSAACGVSLAIRSDLFDRLNGFATDFFSYYEDTDLSLRARVLGYRCRYAPAALVRHVHAGSVVERSSRFNRIVAESRTLFLSRYASPLRFWGRIVRELTRSLGDLRVSSTERRPHLEALLGCACRIPCMLRNRAKYWLNGYFWRIPRLSE
jgi:GT2 family glycosyltransferase